ncbi:MULTISPECIES: C40 family peptidase [unclassified Symbiopectobacterium]|uniref:C40 family peptidase n=1 Tax=unclassified Symbiopectobacterium TaxID=2794573 RepID=UPI002227689A|nr:MULTISPECIES: C40 family peptidase [unclassified Symbiopectobacterium]MCW2474141.1 C40 family peptidase [Candidatus Symbiopectobacterium sp. NZEC151]MCW2485380.1 C40 family peptidase [Candidatus Symbiopectobacterium sp. NZEC127]
MRVFITLIFVFFSHLFINVAQAAPHTNAEKKASASTDDKHLKKNQTTKTTKKPQTPPEPPKKKATPEKAKAKAQPEKKIAEKKVVEKKAKIAPSTKPTKTTATKKISGDVEAKTAASKTTSSRYHSATPAKLVKGLKKGAETTTQKTAAIKPGAKKAGKEPVLSEAHKRRYQHAKMTAMNKLMSQIGKPYQWGGNSPYTGFDCSGLVYYAYKDVVKIPIPRTANEMYHLRDAAPINKGELEIGDLVFFRINGRGTADHVGVYLGNGKFIQSPRTGADIKISKLSEDYWQEHYIGARRVVTPQTIR